MDTLSNDLAPLKLTDAEPTQGSDGNTESVLTLRALVTSKEAGVIIGKKGKNVAELREVTGCRAGVSKAIPGVFDRILSVSGAPESLGKAFEMIAASLLEGEQAIPPRSDKPLGELVLVRLLIAHSLMGSVIGIQGAKIKEIQDTTLVRMVAAKEMLPRSTERIVEVVGQPAAIGLAVKEITTCVAADLPERSAGTILYNPGSIAPDQNSNVLARPSGFGGVSVLDSASVNHQYAPSSPASLRSTSVVGSSFGSSATGTNRRTSYGTPGRPQSSDAPASPTAQRRTLQPSSRMNASASANSDPNSAGPPSRLIAGLEPNDPNLKTQNISFPADMVGCIIGRGGTKIQEIRKLSGSRINISKDPNPETGERLFSIIGTAESNEKALFLLYSSLEAEKERRAQIEA